MKTRCRSLPILLTLILFINSCSERNISAWDSLYPEILDQISIPEFSETIYDITDFGAKNDDPAFLNHNAINSAIDKCSSNGGGIVLIPEGKWYSGPLLLKNNVNLHISEGASLIFASDTSLYPSVLTRWEGMDCYNTSPMIYAHGQENIAISGKGTIDGGASQENWWGMKRLTPVPGKKLRGRLLLMAWNENNTPLEERILSPGDNLRPQLINLYKCKNILITDVTLTRPAFWTIHPVFCENITVRGLTINTVGAPNGDGCNPESCRNVLIESCFFNTGDDCIAIKSGRNNDGRKWNIPSENIIVRNCHMQNGHGGVVIGSEISGGFRNLFAEDCEMNSPSLDRVIRIKTNNCRGGTVENIYVRNIDVGQCGEAVLRINLVYEPGEICKRDFPPSVKNVYLENVNCRQSRYGVFITGYEGSANIGNINISDCEWTNVKEDNRLEGRIDNIRFIRTSVNGTPVKL
ncbi:MAG TPA: glycoside hydrolase family 28 protein [Bacteroidales bacterium]|nr:glycoside hydrolase family 28 protein [Bacteroidales bacterium]HPI68275.1 glycoside hydrolase family 28 protein [Bacteroidales bacterium]HPR72893.1 glycoside hydrolase family 28 protein [Bacteroidales bacterium]